MGKSLIIKGADFSQVAVPDPSLTWFIDAYRNERNIADVTPSAGGFVPGNYEEVQGKSINRLKFYYVEGSLLTIGVVDSLGSSANVTQRREIDTSQCTPNTVVTVEFETINVPANGYICLCPNGDGFTKWKYMNGGGTDGEGFYFYVGSPSASGELVNKPTHDLNVSFGYYG